MDITIRPAKPGDIPRMCDLLADLFTLESDFKPDAAKQAAGLSMLVTCPSSSSLVLVAVMGRQVVGMTMVQALVSTAEGGRVGLVEDVIVDREFRGRGIGIRLLDEVTAWGKRRTLKRIQLLADRDNGPALDFYAKHGWSETSLICLRKML
jgi:GNAT superfamily N-acetyltransferase